VELTDAELVRRALAGDATAFESLFDRHVRVCLRYSTRMLGSREDAEEVTQEAFVRVHDALDRYDGQTPFRTWLLSILINRCRTVMQQNRRRTARIVLDEEAVREASVEPRERDAELREAIGRALARLESAQREAFLLKHVEQLSYDEMALITGAGVSALKMRVQRACERLKVLLEELQNERR